MYFKIFFWFGVRMLNFLTCIELLFDIYSRIYCHMLICLFKIFKLVAIKRLLGFLRIVFSLRVKSITLYQCQSFRNVGVSNSLLSLLKEPLKADDKITQGLLMFHYQ